MAQEFYSGMKLANDIKVVAKGLEALDEKFVFVGGAVVECYATSRVAEHARPTDDIDVVLELEHFGKYGNLQERLINVGFNPDSGSKVICRYTYRGISVDIMPDNQRILGFTNKWYKDGIKDSVVFPIDNELNIRIFPSPIYVATKIEAYYHRGVKDKRVSHDFEDIIYVIENRKEFFDEFASAKSNVKEFISNFVRNILAEKDTNEAISAAIGYSPMLERVEFVRNVLNKISSTR